MHKRNNDGNTSGIKLDRFRQSRFEQKQRREREDFSTVTTPNTIGGAWEENRGRRSACPEQENYDNPFENGRVRNWGHKEGWDNYYSKKTFRPGKHGGGIIGNDHENHVGRGPKGYKRSDERIYEDVCETLALSPDVDASDIEVVVKDGLVYLQGKVQDRQMKRSAELEIENISGVYDVQNELQIMRRSYEQSQSEH